MGKKIQACMECGSSDLRKEGSQETYVIQQHEAPARLAKVLIHKVRCRECGYWWWE